jgi:hypothetical protein
MKYHIADMIWDGILNIRGSIDDIKGSYKGYCEDAKWCNSITKLTREINSCRARF